MVATQEEGSGDSDTITPILSLSHPSSAGKDGNTGSFLFLKMYSAFICRCAEIEEETAGAPEETNAVSDAEAATKERKVDVDTASTETETIHKNERQKCVLASGICVYGVSLMIDLQTLCIVPIQQTTAVTSLCSQALLRVPLPWREKLELARGGVTKLCKTKSLRMV